MLLAIALGLSTLTSSFDVSGVQVILRQSTANNVVAAEFICWEGPARSPR